jgi:hypothetical protein
MGHHHREEVINEPQNSDSWNKNGHPFLGTNDLAYLSIVLPLLSEPGKQLISFFINFGNAKPVSSINDPINLIKQLAPKIDNNALKEMLPTILTMLSNQDNLNAVNPSILSSMMANLGSKKEEQI